VSAKKEFIFRIRLESKLRYPVFVERRDPSTASALSGQSMSEGAGNCHIINEMILQEERSRTGNILVDTRSALHIEPWAVVYILGKEPRRGKPGVLPLLRELRELGVV
jgi:hypothetical protein